jgi:hypothetical protein
VEFERVGMRAAEFEADVGEIRATVIEYGHNGRMSRLSVNPGEN